MKNDVLTRKRGTLCQKEIKKTEFLTLEYRMYEQSDCKVPYSIEIVATNGQNEISGILEHCFDLKEEAKAFFEVISRNLVTPISLSYIYEDYCE